MEPDESVATPGRRSWLATLFRVPPATWLALRLIRGYQRFVSPLLPSSCRFEPSCSQYGYEAIAKYGIIKGGWLTVWRILRCNPFCRGGYDPVR